MKEDTPQIPRLILHIPHSSSNIPYMEGFVDNETLIWNEQLKLTDWDTDQLFYSMDDISLVPDFSRIFCDVERFADDSQEVMARYGMGVLYEKTDTGEPLRHVTPELRDIILRLYYHKHHAAFSAAVNEQLKLHGQAVIIDCHSFSDTPFVRDLNQAPNRPDINIGTDPYHTPEKLLAITREYFSSAGYSVGINRPYSGTIVPSAYYRSDQRVHSIMIEVNRKLYLNDNTSRKNDEFIKTERLIHNYLEKVRLAYGFTCEEDEIPKKPESYKGIEPIDMGVTWSNPQTLRMLEEAKEEFCKRHSPEFFEEFFSVENLMALLDAVNKKYDLNRSLVYAIKKKDLAAVKKALSQEASLEFRFPNITPELYKTRRRKMKLQSPFDFALESGDKQIIRLLLGMGAKPLMREDLYEIYTQKHRGLTDQELLEMASLFSKVTGIDRVILWIGPDPHGDEVRVKVNNIPDNTKNFDFFDIVLPDYKIRGEVNTGFITDEVLQKIIRFIERNKKIILSYSACEITSDELVSHLKR